MPSSLVLLHSIIKFSNHDTVILSNRSPDGYTLFCCSLDGSVASFQFEVKELGEKISDAEMEEFKKSRYGDLRVRQVVIVIHLLSE